MKETVIASMGRPSPVSSSSCLAVIKQRILYGLVTGTYMTQKRSEWEASIVRAGEHLAGSDGYITNGAPKCHNN